MPKNTKSHIEPSRKKKLPAYRSFRLNGKIQADRVQKTSSMKTLWRETWIFLWTHRYKMLQFVGIYTITYLIFVKGFSGFTLDAEALKFELRDALTGNIGAVITSIALYSSLLSSITVTPDEIANYYQATVVTIFSLAFIWLVRKLHLRNSKATVKDSFYQGMRPLIPFLAVVLVMLLQLVPAGVGVLIFAASQSASTAVGSGELLGVTVLAILGIVLTIYLLAGSVFALYISTLPDVTPMVALRSSMKLLRIHRWIVLRKILAFFVVLIILGFVLVLPFIIWLPQYAEVAFFVMSCASFAVMHTFLYKLYRSML